MMEPKLKRYVVLKMSEVPKSDLYPNGCVYEISFVSVKRSGDEERFFMTTEYLSNALDEADAFLDTGVVGG